MSSIKQQGRKAMDELIADARIGKWVRENSGQVVAALADRDPALALSLMRDGYGMTSGQVRDAIAQADAKDEAARPSSLDPEEH